MPPTSADAWLDEIDELNVSRAVMVASYGYAPMRGADADELAIETAATPANKPSQSFRETFMAKSSKLNGPSAFSLFQTMYRCDDKSSERPLSLTFIKDFEQPISI